MEYGNYTPNILITKILRTLSNRVSFGIPTDKNKEDEMNKRSYHTVTYGSKEYTTSFLLKLIVHLSA